MSLNQKKNMRFISGNEALAQGAYEEGLRVACAYPGTPSTEILEYYAHIPEIDAQWSVNEKVAFEVALGASVRGARSLCAAKHVGVNVAMDPLMTSAYTGVGAGFVLVSCDDPGIHSSQNEQDNRLFAKAAKIPLIEPSSPSEAYAFIKTAFQVSEEFDTPVMVRMTTRISHTKENIVIGTRKDIPVRPFTVNVPKYVMVPGNAYKRHIELEQRLVRLKQYAEKTFLNTIEINNREIGFITSGVSYLYAKEMYPGASFLKLGFSWPFPETLARSFSKKVKKVYIIEELEPFLEEHVRLAGIPCTGKHPSFRIGELRPEHIPYIVRGKSKEEKASGARKPVLCPGCPHRSVFTVLKKLKKIVAGDIGCYTLGALPPLSSLHTCLCMGSGITFFEGFGKAGERNAVGVIGDSTFVHSGITGLINAAYNKARGVIIILDNSTTAMTGNQPHPGTGVTMQGEQTKKLSLEDLCRVCGADSVDVINPRDVTALEKLIIRRTRENALSVIIARYPCRFVLKVGGCPPAYDKNKCKKCYMCLTVDCPAVRKSEDGYIVVDNSLCAGCNVCVEMCGPGALERNKTKHEA
ncbi:MAG: thiamine pyrophosphate-dependent enzyme [Candidatus Omnitrophica bacterium]|nr:thiamine pyrophosphate-dependent enzyme [Candidatus Omnitrophota bacterium]